MNDKYLPIGTVVELNTGEGKYMIAGYGTVKSDPDPKFYDYITYGYPHGMLKSDQVFLICASDIKNVVFNGFVNDEFNKFINKYKDYLTDEKKQEIIDHFESEKENN